MSHISLQCVIVGCNSIALEADLDGELLYLMVDDFNDFSAIVTNPVDRRHLKKFVKTYSVATKTMGSCTLRPDNVNKGSLDQFMVSFMNRTTSFPKICTCTLRAPLRYTNVPSKRLDALEKNPQP